MRGNDLRLKRTTANEGSMKRCAPDIPRKLTIAMLGTRGVPAKYGGFETAVEEVGRRLAAKGHEIIVFCRGQGPERYDGMDLVSVPALKSKALETLTHTALSILHPRARSADVAIIFNAANAPLLPLQRLFSIPSVVHVDGLEWQRSKWGRVGRGYYKRVERLAVRWADALIADAQGIQDYYQNKFGADTHLIAYGAPIVASTDERAGKSGEPI